MKVALALGLVALVALALGAPLLLQVRVGEAQGAGQGQAQALLNLTQRAITVGKSLGINVTQAEELYSRALSYYNNGNYTGAQDLCLEALKYIASEAKGVRPTYMPPAYGIEAQLLAIERFVNGSPAINSTDRSYVISRVDEALKDISSGNVSGAAEILADLKGYLANLSVRVSMYAKHAMIGRLVRELHKARGELEANWSYMQEANVSPAQVADEVVKELEEELNSSAANATPAQLVGLARAVEEIESRAPMAEPFPNATGRVMLYGAQVKALVGINRSLSRVESLMAYLTGSEANLSEEALNLTFKAINATLTALHYYAAGEDNLSLEYINQSITFANESAGIAENLTSSGHGMAAAVGRGIYRADELIIGLDEKLYAYVESQNIVGKVYEFRGELLFAVNQTTYVAVLRIVNGTQETHHVIFALVVIGEGAHVNANLTQLPLRVDVVGQVAGAVHYLYVVKAFNVTELAPEAVSP
ncbi:hypothetical protein ASAC_0580 [Acidilobus saccharovorans 345-15]|uniref:Uncharacterized protein n=1 Tax=Acidilobus saccharovorans (strain DSM 16705 / JCM 18335 / VKM B-2471 / 345-15) TaxID=666510 RepID=D9Q0Z9_ACIS3|nr:hypothetical protein [Acidilobus saccharovorans]ADL18987.1 hypothetical protein ASAC_0580 [Acidilobus saccharovorans 345-15]